MEGERIPPPPVVRSPKKPSLNRVKGRWRILYKKTEYCMFNLKYIIMAAIMLHNLCISCNDPCESRWRLEVHEFALFQDVVRREDKDMSDLNRLKISNWLWNM